MAREHLLQGLRDEHVGRGKLVDWHKDLGISTDTATANAIRSDEAGYKKIIDEQEALVATDEANVKESRGLLNQAQNALDEGESKIPSLSSLIDDGWKEFDRNQQVTVQYLGGSAATSYAYNPDQQRYTVRVDRNGRTQGSNSSNSGGNRPGGRRDERKMAQPVDSRPMSRMAIDGGPMGDRSPYGPSAENDRSSDRTRTETRYQPWDIDSRTGLPRGVVVENNYRLPKSSVESMIAEQGKKGYHISYDKRRGVYVMRAPKANLDFKRSIEDAIDKVKANFRKQFKPGAQRARQEMYSSLSEQQTALNEASDRHSVNEASVATNRGLLEGSKESRANMWQAIRDRHTRRREVMNRLYGGLKVGKG